MTQVPSNDKWLVKMQPAVTIKDKHMHGLEITRLHAISGGWNLASTWMIPIAVWFFYSYATYILSRQKPEISQLSTFSYEI